MDLVPLTHNNKNCAAQNVLFIPKMKKNFLSVSQMLGKNLKVGFHMKDGRKYYLIGNIIKRYKLVAKGFKKEGMFSFSVPDT
jgi:hypothetical protein